MSSEAITQNDLREILSRTVGSIPSEYKKLLWTNPNTASAFTAQTISIDLSDYDEVEVWFNCWRNRPNTSLQFRVKKGTYGIATQGASTNTSSGINPFVVGSYIIVQDRPIYVTDTGVQFGTCTEGASNGTMYNADGSMIPTYIYGIKYERVAPPQVEYPNYSTEEQQVGTWATGKPLYRKVFQYASMPNNTTATYAHNISNMDIVVRYTCCWWDSNDGRFIIGPRVDSSAIMIVCAINKTNIILQAIGTNWATRTSNVNVIVEYTKTTD